MNSKDRTRQMLEAALQIAQRPQSNYLKVTRDHIAEQCGVSVALVSLHLGTVQAMRRAIMRHAVAVRCAPVVAQGLCSRDRWASRADAALRTAASEVIA